jgi:hypothetical protein
MEHVLPITPLPPIPSPTTGCPDFLSSISIVLFIEPMPPTSMNLLASWPRLGNKSKEQLQKPSKERRTSPSLPPESGREKVTAAEAADPLPCRDSLGLLHSAHVHQPENIPTSDGEDTSSHAHNEGAAVTGEYVTVPYSPTTPIVVIPPYNR